MKIRYVRMQYFNISAWLGINIKKREPEIIELS